MGTEMSVDNWSFHNARTLTLSVDNVRDTRTPSFMRNNKTSIRPSIYPFFRGPLPYIISRCVALETLVRNGRGLKELLMVSLFSPRIFYSDREIDTFTISVVTNNEIARCYMR